MRTSYFLPYTLVVGLHALLLWIQLVKGHSPPPRPIKRLIHPSTISLEIIPRHSKPPTIFFSGKRTEPPPRSSILRHDDSFRLIISAFDETFFLHLSPNDHLVHPAARVHYYTTSPSGNSVITHTKPLLPESVRAYLGEVIHSTHSPTRLREDAARFSRVQSHPHGANGDAVLGWARITVHDQGDTARGAAPIFEGAFSVNGTVYNVRSKDNYLRFKNTLDSEIDPVEDDRDTALVIWRDADIMTAEEEHYALTGERSFSQASVGHTCGHDRLSYNVDPAENPFLQRPLSPGKGFMGWPSFSFGSFANFSMSKRDDVQGSGLSTNFADRIGQTAGCPTEQKVLYMGVAADCAYVSSYGSRDNATQQILTAWNTASSLYKSTFNISLGIIELQVQDPTCPTTANSSVPWNVGCSDSMTLNERLSVFSQWRGDKGNDGAGLWHLMSGCPTGTEVGIAWLATLCTQTANGNPGSVVSGTAVSTGGTTEWQVIAHEIGHNFGAIHDCADGCNSTSACCPLSTSTCDANSMYIMSPVARSSEKVFSPCTLGNICSVIGGLEGSRLNSTCLIDPSDQTRQVISLEMCGNGIVETGEDCDPGLGVNSTCCDSATCKFATGAVCDPASSPCCTDTCSFAPSTQVCRASKDPNCDTAEMCTGNSSACPPDVFAPNGQSCGNGLACASGQCTSNSKQCRTVGASMNLTTECPNHNSASCQISCQDPDHANQCILLSATLIDGSPCGYGGTCVSGNCQSASLLDTAKAWYLQNLNISIPVTIGAGLVVLLILLVAFRSFRSCCRRKSRETSIAQPSFANLRRARLASYDQRARGVGLGVPPPLVPTATRPSHLRSHSHSNWVDETLYNGPRPT